MGKPWLLILALLHLHSSRGSAFPRISVGIGGGGGVGVWINGDPPPNPSDPASSSDYDALQAWKSAITEDPNGLLASWVGPNVCTYKGVFCSQSPEQISDTVIRGIDLNRANLRGSLVPSLSLLTHLSILHLNSNRLFGTVPDSFRALRFLTELDLSNNQLSGSFPIPTLFIPSLIYLDLRFNGFSGELPDEIFETRLDAIFLNNNRFTGPIPMSLWASPASVVTLANNQFSGPIPSGFGFMGSGIREILFLNNSLTGCVPEGIGYLQDVEVLDFSFNSLVGHLPDSLSCLSGVEVLNIAHNELSGELPDLCNIHSLANLSVAFNFFSGIGQDCARVFFRNMGFDFSWNCIPGSGMQRAPPECMGVPGGGMSCFRMPPRPAACVGGFRGQTYPLPAASVP